LLVQLSIIPVLCLFVQGATQIGEPGFVAIWNLLDILQYCGDRGMHNRSILV
jgi:hypothetical protein